jgi:hypothetical protein
MTLPNYPPIEASTPQTIRTQAGIPRDAFLRAYERA